VASGDAGREAQDSVRALLASNKEPPRLPESDRAALLREIERIEL